MHAFWIFRTIDKFDERYKAHTIKPSAKCAWFLCALHSANTFDPPVQLIHQTPIVDPIVDTHLFRDSTGSIKCNSDQCATASVETAIHISQLTAHPPLTAFILRMQRIAVAHRTTATTLYGNRPRKCHRYIATNVYSIVAFVKRNTRLVQILMRSRISNSSHQATRTRAHYTR